jgi:hypothetical protein
MRHCILAAITLLMAAASPPLLAQGQRLLPRTADGHPDLQGVWNFSTITPLERPAEFADKPFLTDAEAKALEQRTIERSNRDNRDRNNAEADVSGAYNEFWWDRGVHAARVRGRIQTSLIVDPPDGRIPALTPDGQARADQRAAARRLHPADGPEDRSLAERCLLFNAGPPMLSGPYNNYVQLLQTRDHIVIFNEMVHDVRIVPLDGRPQLAAGVRAWQGDPRGRWEGETLVVESSNFSGKTNVRGSGEALRLVERFTRTGGNTLLYEFTVNDPASFTTPWTAALPMAKTTDQIYEYACHEANYAMAGILRGARSAEKQ